MTRLTELKLQSMLKDRKPRVIAVGDGSGLSLRITPAAVSWQLRYRIEGKAHWLTLGAYPECTLKEAQKRTTRERARIGEGVDPIADRRRVKAALAAAQTVQDLAADYEARGLPGLAPATQKNVRRALKTDILPRLGKLKIEAVTGSDVVRMVEAVGLRSVVCARVAFSVTSILYSHGQAKHLARSNPCAGLRLSAILGKKQPFRPTVSLSEPELRKVLPALPVIGNGNALALKIVLATCVRKGEIRQARWEQIDLFGATWSIPAANAKNRKAFVIPLAPVVVGWFQELKELAHGSAWILPGVDRKRPISDSTLNAALDLLIRPKSPRKKGIPEGLPVFTIHDLRRTARTHLGRLGVDVITAERCLNHSLGGLVEVYDRGDYFEQRVRAMQLLADFIVRCETVAENVVSLRKAG